MDCRHASVTSSPAPYSRETGLKGIDDKAYLVVKCSEYSNAIELEWSERVPAGEIGAYLEKNAIICKFERILAFMIEQPSAKVHTI
jgi:hypothetical protein